MDIEYELQREIRSSQGRLDARSWHAGVGQREREKEKQTEEEI